MKGICLIFPMVWIMSQSVGQSVLSASEADIRQNPILDPNTSRAWTLMRQMNSAPFLAGMPQRLGKTARAAQADNPIWTGVPGGGGLDLDLVIEGDLSGEVLVGFFVDATWSTNPVQVRVFPTAGRHVVGNLPPGQYRIGAMIGQLPVPKGLGVHQTWPQPIAIEQGKTAGTRVLLSAAFMRCACTGGGNTRVLRDHAGDWADLAPGDLVQGKVTGPAGEPVPFNDVMIREYKPGAESCRWVHRGTAENGVFKSDDVAWPNRVYIQRHELIPSALGFRYQQTYLNKALEGPQTLDLQFGPFPTGTGRIEGRVTDQHGHPVREFIVDAGTWPTYMGTYEDRDLCQKAADGNRYEVIGYRLPFISEDGTFRLEGLPAARYMVCVVPFGIRPGDRIEYVNAPDSPHHCEIDLEAGGTSRIDVRIIIQSEALPSQPFTAGVLGFQYPNSGGSLRAF